MKIANTMEIRLQNAVNILNDIECSPGITNTEIALSRGLSIPTISNIVNILKGGDVVITAGTGVSSGGRRPIQLSLNPEYQYSIGVSIARHTVYLILIDFEGHILEQQRYYFTFEETDEYWQEIDNMIQKIQKVAPGTCGVGLALPGFIDYENGVALNTYTLGTSTVSLDHIYRILGDTVSIGDSCKLAAMAQVFAQSNIEDSFFILLSRRVSGILIHDNSILKLKSSSMDIGAMIIDTTKTEPLYGAPGSLSEMCSASKIIDLLKDHYSLNRYEDFFDEIKNGNEELASIWETYMKNLAIAIYNIYSIFKTKIVIGGEMAKYLQPCLEDLLAEIREVSCEDKIELVLNCSIYGEYDDAYGAALETRTLYLYEKLPEMLRNAAAAAPAPVKKAKGRSKKR